ncbi:VapE domain-containing protein [Marivivens sp. JLT3646]|uniref:VapE domain-containing protein n=1 Tax=Marivivens sp. JLT3646 TaxID=1920883 RepID=UPI0007FD93A4|nr:VapE domain-containing protein [Marivivens sp. JLT3646]APO86159.1 hypothetical protein BSK21_03335 [Marivivens sp. JLT3646]OBR38034.1 hypothetical protein A9199_15465 [Donghicola sp. JL3646]
MKTIDSYVRDIIQNTNSKQQAATYYASLGWKVFPVAPNSKAPLTAAAPKGYKNASNDPIKVSQWWTQYPDANIGLNLVDSGLVCVDIDSYKENCVANDMYLLNQLPETLVQKSARGGTHHIYSCAANHSFAGQLGEGIDLKHKGYILLSPSTFNGGRYAWVNNVEPVLVPTWLPKAIQSTEAALLTFPASEPQAKFPLQFGGVDIEAALSEAGRGLSWHNNVLAAVGSLVARGYSDADIHAKTVLATTPEYTCEDTFNEVQKMIDGARQKGFDKSTSNFMGPIRSPRSGTQEKRICNHSNVIEILSLHPEWSNAFGFDAFDQKEKILKALPANQSAAKEHCPRDIEDSDYTPICIWLNQMGFTQVSKDIVRDCVGVLCKLNTYNPVVDYLDYVQSEHPANDDLLSNWVHDYLGAHYEDEAQKTYVTSIARLVLIQAVARARQPGCKADAVVILEGRQGLGKSTLLKELFGESYFGDQLPPMSSKDASSYLNGKWCVELAELDYKTKVEVETIKAFVTRTEENYRPPYGRNEVRRQRTCVMIGTTNRDDYLVDDTGNRRFLPLQITKVDLEAIKANKDKLWAAASHAFSNGEAYWLTGETLKVASNESKKRFESDPWVEAINANLSHLEETSLLDAYLECFPGMTTDRISQADSRRMSACLHKAGWEKSGRFTTGDRRNQVKFVNPDPKVEARFETYDF